MSTSFHFDKYSLSFSIEISKYEIFHQRIFPIFMQIYLIELAESIQASQIGLKSVCEYDTVKFLNFLEGFILMKLRKVS